MKFASRIALLLCIAGAAFASTCTTGTLASYATSGFSCMVGSRTFNNFNAALVSVNGTPTSLANINVVPTANGFNFVSNFNAPAGLIPSAVDLAVIYTGFAPVNNPFTGATLSLSGASVTGLGAIVAVKAFCLNGSLAPPSILPLTVLPVCSSGVTVNANLLTNITDANLAATLTFGFAPVTELAVLDSLTLAGPDILGSATVSSINNGLLSTPVPPAVPEPSSLLLMGSGMAALASFGRRVRQRCSH